jgi:CheY-like chemotaxis protein
MNPETQTVSLHVLLAEDDTDDLFFFAKVLKAIPIPTRLTTVNNGEHLLTYLFENTEQLPDVLFLDINMPLKNGYECLEVIRENKMLKDLYVVMFSTFYSRFPDYESEIANKLLNLGKIELIRKPNDLNLLKEIVQQVLINAGKIKSLNYQKDCLPLPADSGMTEPTI